MKKTFKFPNNNIIIIDEKPTFDEQLEHMNKVGNNPTDMFINMMSGFKDMMSVRIHIELVKWCIDTIIEWDRTMQGPNHFPKVKEEIIDYLNEKNIR